MNHGYVAHHANSANLFLPLSHWGQSRARTGGAAAIPGVGFAGRLGKSKKVVEFKGEQNGSAFQYRPKAGNSPPNGAGCSIEKELPDDQGKK